MAAAAIHATGLGKRFRLAHGGSSFPTLRDAVTGSARRLGRMFRPPGLHDRASAPEAETFWALRDVSFDVAQGEVVGIIGGNGAGKSTLLKLLSRITPPTEGTAEIRGRVGSLLEVGTGFHPELSGRENTFLNGAILGMTRGEIARKFDEIVAFAEVERFIDMPVKHYSSGMYLRLAFAVAAHLEPEILIVDEVLAVGDAAFQKKCLGKMGNVAHEGRTVLFVSHNLDAVERLCSRCILLAQGRVASEGPAATVVAEYLSRSSVTGQPGTWIDQTKAHHEGSGDVRIVAVRYGGGVDATGPAITGTRCDVECVVESSAARTLSSFAVTIYGLTGVKLVNADSIELGVAIPVGEGRTTIGIRIAQLHLHAGRYAVGLWIGDRAGLPVDHIQDAFELDVAAPPSQTFGISVQGLVACTFEVLSPHATPPAETACHG